MIDFSCTDEKLEGLADCLKDIATLVAENQQIIMAAQETADQMKARIEQSSAAIALTTQTSTEFNTLAETTIQTVAESETLLQSLAEAIAKLKKSDAQALNINGRKIANLQVSINQLEEEQVALTQLLTESKQASNKLLDFTEEALGWIGQKLRQIGRE